MKDLKTFTHLIKEKKIFSSINSSFLQKEIRTIVDQKNETQEILNSLIEAILVFDENLKVTYFNSFAEKLFKGLKKGKDLKDFSISEDFFKICDEIIKICNKKKKVVKKSIFLEKKYFDVLGILKKDGIILIFQDRTSDYKIINLGKDFIANASHELRTPITIIRGFSETLKDIPKLSSDMIKSISKKIIDTSIRLENLINDLLLLEKIEHMESLALSKCSLVGIFKNVKSFLTSIYKDVEIEIEYDEEVYILGKESLLELAFKNLLENSIKYSEKRPVVNIKLEKIKNNIKCSIKDNGIGIPYEEIKNIFDRFYRTDRVKKQRGTGLGLSLVKNIIQKHRGMIKVFSKENLGTTFEIFFKSF